MKKPKKTLKNKRERRYFSEDFRRARVKEYDAGQTSVSEICRAYQVSSTAVYKWIHKYSAHYEKAIVKVTELKSETKKRLNLEKKVTELEQIIGQLHVQNQYYQKLLEMIQEHYNVDFEKNSDWKSLNGSFSNRSKHQIKMEQALSIYWNQPTGLPSTSAKSAWSNSNKMKKLWQASQASPSGSSSNGS